MQYTISKALQNGAEGKWKGRPGEALENQQ